MHWFLLRILIKKLRTRRASAIKICRGTKGRESSSPFWSFVRFSNGDFLKQSRTSLFFQFMYAHAHHLGHQPNPDHIIFHLLKYLPPKNCGHACPWLISLHENKEIIIRVSSSRECPKYISLNIGYNFVLSHGGRLR